MSNEKAVFHQGRWWAQRDGQWLFHDGGAWVRPPSAPPAGMASPGEIAGLAAGIVGFIAAVFYQAIGGALFLLFPATALGLALGAAVSATGRVRRALGMWALVLGSVMLGIVALAVGAHLGLYSGAVVYAATPMLIGLMAIWLSATGMIARRGRQRRRQSWELSLGSPPW